MNRAQLRISPYRIAILLMLLAVCAVTWIGAYVALGHVLDYLWSL